jgi:hypothetical protein
MVGVDKDHLVVLVGGVLAHPVGVQHAQALQPPANLVREKERTTLKRLSRKERLAGSTDTKIIGLPKLSASF